MTMPSDPQPPQPPGQTIVLDRRERPGCLRRLLWPVLILSILLNAQFIAEQVSRTTPDRLNEQYVAGSMVPTADAVAVVRVEGVIALDTVEYAVKQLRLARRNEQVKAVVLRVDSPGGTVTGSDQIWREVELVKRAGKPVVVSMGGLAASGGYYVSAPADRILAEPTTTTGSIGVILELPNVSELLDKVGVEMKAVTAGEWKGMGTPFEPFTERELNRYQELVDSTYGRFLRVVASGRELTLERAREVADGKVYTADEALELGLIDRLGYLEDAIAEATELAQLEEPRVFRYAKPLTLTDALFGLSTTEGPEFTLDEKALMSLRRPRMLMIMR